VEFLKDVFKFENKKTILGLTKELNIFFILETFKNSSDNVIVLASTLYEANKIYSSLKTYEEDVLLFPMDDFLSSVALAISPELKINRLETLKSLDNKKKIIVTNLMGYLRFLPDKAKKNELEINLKTNSSIDRNLLIDNLINIGYSKETIVTTTGEFAVRGFVIDVFPTHMEHPIRIELFGNEIDSIRIFDETSQLSIEETKECTILPNSEVKTNIHSSLLDYANNPIVFYIDYDQIMANYKKIVEEMYEYRIQEELEADYKFMFELEEIVPNYYCYINNLTDNILDKNNTIIYNSKELENYNSNFDKLKEDYEKWQLQKKKVIFYLSKDKQVLKLRELLGNNINIVNKKINKGFILDDYVIVSEFDIENVSNKEIKYKNSFRIGQKIKDFDQLKKGDYVIHTIHGIGIYNGIITLNTNNIKKDYIQIDYLENDKVYIPVEKINTIYKYSDKDGTRPTINKLNSTKWINTKRSIQKKVQDISTDLLKLYAARKALVGPVYKNYDEELIFANKFQYAETKDQLKAIKEIDGDLQSKVPMDRLLCGDVGFGKTEVAFRAIFKTLVNNKQVMYLCPTTILSKQQYNTALERFKDYPLEIALLNRFTTPKEVKRIIEGLKEGKIDLVFGTHRLLSDDIEFKKLGLLVVDEEQRFGVTHKEKIKTLKNDVNVLTLSATPIPRTLKMALSGLRDLSIIDTPPVNRYPIQTYVVAENDLLIKDAIYKELSRNGQIFVLYNNIAKLEEKARELQKLVPEARIVYAHGQMNKTELENIMIDFVDYKYDILLCTTIIETGIDIPNANTLIIYEADHYGLSQLYQIRGRVGRSNRIAYAYLLYNKNKILNEVAIKRLQAIKEFTELGSGYRIAMRDLSIRGAGDILGSEQAGFVDSIGISLYMSMIEEEIRRQKGEYVEEEPEQMQSLINVDTHIENEYVSEENLKIEIHQKINQIDSYAKLLEIKNELNDRFGQISESLEIYMYEEWFEKLAQNLNITKVIQNNRFVEIELPEKLSNELEVDRLFMEAYSINNKFKFRYFNKRIIISLSLNGLEKHFLYYLVPLLEKLIN